MQRFRISGGLSIMAIAVGLLAILPTAPNALAEDSGGVPPREVGDIVVSDDGGVVRGDELVDQRTEYSRTFETSLPGVFATEVSTGPLHFEDSEGEWVGFDTDLSDEGPADGLAPVATDVPVEIATDAAAEQVASVEVAEGASVGFGFDGASEVPAEVEGDTAVFADVVPGVDLELTAQPGGVKEAIVLDSAAAPSSFEFPLALDGLSAQLGSDGSVEYRDGTGAMVAVTPAGYMEDSAFGPGVGVQSTGVAYSLMDRAGTTVLRVDLDEAWLTDPARVFPVVVDPTTSAVDPVAVDADDTYVLEGSSPTDRSAHTDLRVGDSGAGVARSYLHFSDLDDFDGMNVYDATLELTQFGANTCAAGAVEAYAVTDEWAGDEVLEFPGPVADPEAADLVAIDWHSGSTGFGAPSGCAASGTVQIHLTRGADNWTNGEWDNLGIMLAAADEETTNGYRRFHSADGTTAPVLQVLWSDPSIELADAPTVSGPFSPEGDLNSTSVVGSAIYDDPNEGDDGHVLYFVYQPDTYNFTVSAGAIVEPGQASEISGTLPWDTRFAMRAMALDGDTPYTGDHSSPLGPWVEFQARSVQITDPDLDQILFGDVTVTASAAVTTNLTSVQFLLDGTAVFTDTTAPYEMAGSSTGTTDGPHSLAARAQYSSGPTRTSATVPVTIDNGLNTQQRLQVDLATDHIDLDEFTEYGVKGLLNQDAIPTRYRSTAEPSVDPTAGVLSYLAHGWESIGSTTQDEIESFVTGSVSADDPLAGCVTDTVILEVLGYEIENTCAYSTDHFIIYYSLGGPHGVPTDDEDDNDRPDYIDEMAANLEDARDTYLGMGYELATGSNPLPVIVLDHRGVASPFGDEGLGHFIVVENEDRGSTYTARHELFHIAQYSYTSLYDLGSFVLDFDDFVDDRATTMWWLEASANWATHKAALDAGDPDGPLEYAASLDDLFAGPNRYFANFDSLSDSDLDALPRERSNARAYGSFIFAEWLEQRYGELFLFDIWDGIGEGGFDGREASEVIEDLLTDADSSIEEALPEFWLASYLFSNDSGLDIPYTYVDPHLDRTALDTLNWQEILAAEVPTQGDDFSGLARPARWSMPQLEGDGDPEEQSVRVEPGGSAFIDLEPEAALQGDLDLTIEVEDSEHLDKYRFSTVAYQPSTSADASGLPAVCQRFGEPAIETFESTEGVFEHRIQIDHRCPTATLAITNIDPNSGDDDGDGFVVTAEFNGTAPFSGIDLVSVDSDEHQGDDDSSQAAISPDGQSVVFASAATDLVDADVGDGVEIYRRQLASPFEDGTTELVSGGDDDVASDDSGYPVASEDGQVVAFASLDDDLDTTDEPSNGAQVYVADLGEDTIERVSLFEPVSGQLATASRPSISHDGRFVAYEGGAYTGLDRPGSPSGISAVYVYDRQEETTTCVSCVGFGVPTALSFDPDISSDGDLVVFSSTESTLVAGDTNGVRDVFTYDLSDDTVTRVSQAPAGGQATVASANPRTGYSGSGVFAYQQGTDIHVIRQGTGTFIIEDADLVDLAGNGIGAITYQIGDEIFQEWPVTTGDTPVPVAVGIGGDPNGTVTGGSLTYEGGGTAFTSAADNLVGSDTNDATDAFTRSLPFYYES